MISQCFDIEIARTGSAASGDDIKGADSDQLERINSLGSSNSCHKTQWDFNP